MLAQFLNYFLSRQNAVANVLVETSGDTGPAAVFLIFSDFVMHILRWHQVSLVIRIKCRVLSSRAEKYLCILFGYSD